MIDFIWPWYSTHWVILGLFLMILEILLPGSFILWVGIAALLVALFLYFVPLTSIWPFVLFSILSLGMAWVGKQFYHKFSSYPSALNKRADQLIGQTFILDTPIVQGKGRIRVGDSVWGVKGPDLPQGTEVKVISYEGITLIVEKN
ncbi:MAG: NfeD family protein [Proteobacteria bacterium]|nr:NfeD family protein [Pseudomonadota bacterium]